MHTSHRRLQAQETQIRQVSNSTQVLEMVINSTIRLEQQRAH
ncbi:hypothetical protein SynROS8604_01965 [Synechococcus sp. ROS8604]|nr:hypothetical protein SynROS8604_01965 [Synechococcus sp. ROS8604]